MRNIVVANIYGNIYLAFTVKAKAISSVSNMDQNQKVKFMREE